MTMGKFVFVYKGGSMPASEAEGAKVMEAWMSWLGNLGAAAVDPGNPFGASSAVASNGSTSAATGGLGGYSIVTAGDLAAAAALAKGCPIFTAGGSLEVYEAMEM
jgi:hypothetical protein